MNELKYFVFVGSLLGSNITLGYTWGTIVFVICAVLIWWIVRNRKRNRMRRMMDNRIEHFYVVEKPNGENITLDFDSDVYFTARPGKVTELANHLAEQLQLSDNQRNLKIYVFRFRHGKRVNETVEQYVEMLNAAIGEYRVAHHAEMEKDESAYLEFHHNDQEKKNENVFEWSGKLTKDSKDA